MVNPIASSSGHQTEAIGKILNCVWEGSCSFEQAARRVLGALQCVVVMEVLTDSGFTY